MRSATILVIDGFGVGAMPDAGALRESDVAADTIGSIASWSTRVRNRPLAIPHLARLGLVALRPELRLSLAKFPQTTVVTRKSALGYPGADTYAGHQTMMGADMSHVTLARVGDHIAALIAALRSAGHQAEALVDVDGTARPVVLVDGAALVHDNLEADPGLNWNVSADLKDMSFAEILVVATIVRRIAPVARVIAVGGHSDGPTTTFVRPGEQHTVGFDTPASGFYRNSGLRVQHLGAAIDHSTQLPDITARHGIPVTLVGKAADILATSDDDAGHVHRRPNVETADVLRDAINASGEGLVIANVQQTDLAGHQQDPERYANLLEQIDLSVPHLLERLGSDGMLVVTGDHGNDPTIGHPFHTREFVPVLVAVDGPPTIVRAPDLASLADLGASVASWLGIPSGSIATGTIHDLACGAGS